MALSIKSTVGASDSNSYLEVSEADQLLEHHLYNDVWNSAVVSKKTAALIWSTELLDQGIFWDGNLKDSATPQSLAWPRQGLQDRDYRVIDDLTIPLQVKKATAELARLLLISDRTEERGTLGFKSVSVGPIKLEVDKLDEVSLIPDSVYNYIKDFGSRIVDTSGGFSQVKLTRS